MIKTTANSTKIQAPLKENTPKSEMRAAGGSFPLTALLPDGTSARVQAEVSAELS